MTTESTRWPSSPERLIKAPMTCAPRSLAGMSFNDPPKEPIGVRTGEQMTMSGFMRRLQERVEEVRFIVSLIGPAFIPASAMPYFKRAPLRAVPASDETDCRLA